MSSNFIMMAVIDAALISYPGMQPTIDQVIYLMHFDGDAGRVSSDKIIDEKGHSNYYPNTRTLAGDVKVFGSTALQFNASDTLPLSMAGTDGIDFEDFTIEMWLRPSLLKHIPQSTTTSIDAGGIFQIDSSNLTTKLRMLIRENGSMNINGLGTLNAPAGTFQKNQWHHVALTRKGTVATLWVNGRRIVQVDASFIATTSLRGGYNRIVFGVSQYSGTTNHGYIGYMDELRIVKGLAVYDAEFTPPTEPFTL